MSRLEDYLKKTYGDTQKSEVQKQTEHNEAQLSPAIKAIMKKLLDERQTPLTAAFQTCQFLGISSSQILVNLSREEFDQCGDTIRKYLTIIPHLQRLMFEALSSELEKLSPEEQQAFIKFNSEGFDYEN
jgi:hypothetical protein